MSELAELRKRIEAIEVALGITDSARIAEAEKRIATVSTTASAAMPKSGGTFTGHVLFTDATYDIGATGATRPRDVFLSRNLTAGGIVDAASYKVGGVAGVDFGPSAVASITVVKGIVTAIS
jgi:hypothetical protein